jgi:hypothetical protein
MRKSAVLRLKRGDHVLFGNKGRFPTMWWEGVVLHVTPRGGIKVRATTIGSNKYADIRWVPYHYVVESVSAEDYTDVTWVP